MQYKRAKGKIQDTGGGNVTMTGYIVEASKNGNFADLSDNRKIYFVSRNQFVELLDPNSGYTVWTARWVNLEVDPISSFEKMYGRKIEKLH